jgi:hypothetical protein
MSSPPQHPTAIEVVKNKVNCGMGGQIVEWLATFSIDINADLS